MNNAEAQAYAVVALNVLINVGIIKTDNKKDLLRKLDREMHYRMDVYSEEEIMKDFDRDKYIKSYCNKRNCHSCDGTDFNGEANGYGCGGLEQRIKTMYNSILKRRTRGMVLVIE